VLGNLLASMPLRDRDALKVLLDADGVMLARVMETRFGDSVDDGFDWNREPPTSVLGRLRMCGLCFVGRASLGPNPRSRPRVVVIPRELREPIARALAVPMPGIEDPTVGEDVIEGVMDDDDQTDEESEAEDLRFERAQPELAAFAAGVGEHLTEAVGPGPLLFYVGRVFLMFDAAHPGRVPRLRTPEIQAARDASSQDLEAVEVMHERLLERRVAHMIGMQPHVYACLAGVLDDLPWSEEDKLLVFHACDTALRAFHAAVLA
jgi:hypothetical protein